MLVFNHLFDPKCASFSTPLAGVSKSWMRHWMISQNGETAGVLPLRQGLEGTLCMHANCVYHLSPLVYRSSGFFKVLACLFVATTLYSLYERLKLIQQSV
jgi:hypothetical protein